MRKKTGLAKMSRPEIERRLMEAEAKAFGAEMILRTIIRGAAEEVSEAALLSVTANAVSVLSFDVASDGTEAQEGDEVVTRCTWALYLPLSAAGGYVLRLTQGDGRLPSVEVERLDTLMGLSAFRAWLPVEARALAALSRAREIAVEEEVAKRGRWNAGRQGDASSFGTGDVA